MTLLFQLIFNLSGYNFTHHYLAELDKIARQTKPVTDSGVESEDSGFRF